MAGEGKERKKGEAKEGKRKGSDRGNKLRERKGASQGVSEEWAELTLRLCRLWLIDTQGVSTAATICILVYTPQGWLVSFPPARKMFLGQRNTG